MYSWYNVPYGTGSNCWLYLVMPPSGYVDGPSQNTFTPVMPNTYRNMSNCVTLVGNSTSMGLIYLHGLVTEGTGRGNTGLTIMEGAYTVVFNGSISKYGRVSGGYVYVDNIVPGSNVSITFDIPNYEKKNIKIFMGNNDEENNNLFILKWIGGEDYTTTLVTTTQYGATTTHAGATTTAATLTTTTIFNLNNYTVYQPSNDTTNILEQGYNIVIVVVGSICGFFGSIVLGITLFITGCIILAARMVLIALGFKGSWIGLSNSDK
jgi:hypothetical protein